MEFTVPFAVIRHVTDPLTIEGVRAAKEGGRAVTFRLLTTAALPQPTSDPTLRELQSVTSCDVMVQKVTEVAEGWRIVGNLAGLSDLVVEVTLNTSQPKESTIKISRST